MIDIRKSLFGQEAAAIRCNTQLAIDNSNSKVNKLSVHDGSKIASRSQTPKRESSKILIVNGSKEAKNQLAITQAQADA